ncbi:hypothetical protein DOE76_00575 [Leifsonia sp. ku-ls]|nr:hypothetical protein DOE76_00575 [Leifsonia sp. ku-ls]
MAPRLTARAIRFQTSPPMAVTRQSAASTETRIRAPGHPRRTRKAATAGRAIQHAMSSAPTAMMSAIANNPPASWNRE